jgi:hypothetical protein
METVRTAETVVDAVDGPVVVVVGIADAADVAAGPVAVDGIAADAAGPAGEDTKNFLPRI